MTLLQLYRKTKTLLQMESVAPPLCAVTRRWARAATPATSPPSRSSAAWCVQGLMHLLYAPVPRKCRVHTPPTHCCRFGAAPAKARLSRTSSRRRCALLPAGDGEVQVHRPQHAAGAARSGRHRAGAGRRAVRCRSPTIAAVMVSLLRLTSQVGLPFRGCATERRRVCCAPCHQHGSVPWRVCTS